MRTRTILTGLALASTLAADTISFCSGQQPDERNNSGYAIEYLTGSPFGCGSQVTTPGLNPAWETGIAYTFPVLDGLLYGIVNVEALDGTAVQLNGQFLTQGGFGAGPQEWTLPASDFPVGTDYLAVFFRGEGLESNRVDLVYASPVPEPSYFWLLPLILIAAVAGYLRRGKA